MPLRKERTPSLEPFYGRQREALRELEASKEQKRRERRQERLGKEYEEKFKEKRLEGLRSEARRMGVTVEEPPRRYAAEPGSRFTATYTQPQYRQRRISAYETALGKEARVEEGRRAEEQRFLGEYKVIKKEAMALEKRLKEEKKVEESLTYFAKRWMGETFNKGTENQYTLDTPEEFLYRYKKQVGTPSPEMRDAVLKLDWPAGGVVETGKAKERRVSYTEEKRGADLETKAKREWVTLEGTTQVQREQDFAKKMYRKIGGRMLQTGDLPAAIDRFQENKKDYDARLGKDVADYILANLLKYRGK